MYKILKVFNIFALLIFLGVMLLQAYVLYYYFFIETSHQKKLESLIGINLFAIQSCFFIGIPSIFSSYVTRKMTPLISRVLFFLVFIQGAITLWAYSY